jgi:hypothetical protein
VNPLTTETFIHLEFLFSVIWGKMARSANLVVFDTFLLYMHFGKQFVKIFGLFCDRQHFSSVDPRVLKIIFCRPFTPDNQVIVFSISDYMFIRGAIFTVCCQQPVNIRHDYTNCCLYTVDPPHDEQQACSKHVVAYY